MACAGHGLLPLGGPECSCSADQTQPPGHSPAQTLLPLVPISNSPQQTDTEPRGLESGMVWGWGVLHWSSSLLLDTKSCSTEDAETRRREGDPGGTWLTQGPPPLPVATKFSLQTVQNSFFFFFSVVPDFAKLWLGRFWASELCTVSALHGSPPHPPTPTPCQPGQRAFLSRLHLEGGSSVPGNAPLPDP